MQALERRAFNEGRRIERDRLQKIAASAAKLREELKQRRTNVDEIMKGRHIDQVRIDSHFTRALNV